MSETKGLSLHQRINEVRRKVAYIKKDKAVDNYKAVTHDAVTAETREWFVEMGVLVVPSELESAMTDTGARTTKGNAIMRYEARYRVDFINVDEPTQILSVVLTAHANDHGDKAPGKTVSYATKYAILKVLQLETGEDDEARTPRNSRPGDEVPEDELSGLLAAIEAAKTLEALQTAYKSAYTRASKDKEAQATVIKAKDHRKAALAGGAK